jgi:hypothetical protein
MGQIENERTKLTATLINNTAIAIIGTGVIAPFFAILYGLSSLSADQIRLFAISVPTWIIVGVALHLIARGILGGLK